MIWVTWRQHRAQILVTAGFLALLGREYERGTHRLAWTQSVSVRRWLTVRLSVLGATAVAGGLLLSLMVSLRRPVFRAGADSTFGNIGVFNMVGVQPAVWWLYAFTLGVAAGRLTRRTLPAMALVVAGVTVTMFTLFRLSAYYAEPARIELSGTVVLTVVLEDPDARLVGAAWVEPSGREVAEPSVGGCPRGVDVGQSDRKARAWWACLFGKGYRYAVYYHPPSRFWRFQWTEAGILTFASLALGGLAVRRTSRAAGDGRAGGRRR